MFNCSNSEISLSPTSSICDYSNEESDEETGRKCEDANHDNLRRLSTEMDPNEDHSVNFTNNITKQLSDNLCEKDLLGKLEDISYKENGSFEASYPEEFSNIRKKVFVKVYQAFGKRKEKSIVEEIKCHLLGTTNENILKIDCITPADTLIGLVMELMPGGSLETVIYDKKKQYEHRVESWILQLSLAIAYLHNQNIIHRDIRPANIFLDAELEKLKLSDFGMAINLLQATFPLNPDNCKLLDNRINYLAPELKKEIKKEELVKENLPFGKIRITTKEGKIFEEKSITNEEGAYTADVYSEGVTIWEVLKRKRPPASFDSNNPDDLSSDPSIAKLLARCLNLDPNERKITSEEVSKWIKDLTTKRETKRKTILLNTDTNKKMRSELF